MDIDWDVVVISLSADGRYSWQLTQKLSNKPENLILQSFAFSALNCWVGRGCSWHSWVEGVQHWPEVKTCRDSASQWLYWLHWAQSVKNWCEVYNWCPWWGSIWEPLGLVLHPLVNWKCVIQTGSWEVVLGLVSFQGSMWPFSLLELEESPLTVKSDMATIVKVMQLPDSGLEIRDRMWLKITISNAVIGEQLKGMLGGKKSVGFRK